MRMSEEAAHRPEGVQQIISLMCAGQGRDRGPGQMALCHVFGQVCDQVTLLNAFHITDSTPAVAQIKRHESRGNLLSLLCVAG
jgi:hypothetical protein